jgi:hypothetical protein
VTVDFALRPAEAGDVAYIVDTWVGSALKMPTTGVLGERPAYQLTWRARRVMIKLGARVACDPVDPSTIYGWAAVKTGSDWHADVFLWAYVREDFRGQGLVKAMIADLLDGREVVSATKGPAGKLPSGWKHMAIALDWAMSD